MNNIMLDIETLGTVITQIGAVYFDDNGNIGDKFLVNVNIESCLKYGLEIQYKNLKWWLERTNLITWMKNTIPISVALAHLTEFCNKNKKARVWSHYYDIMILEFACYKIGRKLPFHYKRWRDLRTAVDLADLKKEKKKENEKTHNALDDCIYQINYLTKALKVLKNEKQS
ncbi:MAG TPA: 3'-5' exoribonuclease [Candidatus Desulfofervidus auxilii]|uniref:3'-5' exoribonuclease n=1 Tax=Desulfofervidus auxilii TaxID=1621989 RepID=A0A7C0Y6L5_DESA2|nr:3'-5' exoribonuclease [Candidatus Desulfofervidus auxilii]